MKELRFEYRGNVLSINARKEHHTTIKHILETKPYFDGLLPGDVGMANTHLIFYISPLVEMEDLETLLTEIKTALSITDDDVLTQ